MKAKLYLTVYYVLASMWALVVLSVTPTWTPAKAWGLAIGGAMGIGTVGLRMYHAIEYRNAMRVKPLASAKPWIAAPEPFEQEHLTPYIDQKVRIRRAAARR